MLVIKVIVFVICVFEWINSLRHWPVLQLDFLSGHISKMYLAKMKHFEIQIMTNIFSIGN